MSTRNHKPCRKCHVRPIANNGYCDACDPHRIVSVKHHDAAIPDGVCIGWQRDGRLDGRRVTYVHRMANYERED